MRCIVCDQNDWENVDQYRELAKHDGQIINMSMCKNCGFVSYPSKYRTKEEIKEYYQEQYRGTPPTFNHFVTGERKLHYHQHFLREVFKKWQENKVKPVVGEVGGAIGMALNMYTQLFPEAEVHGTEWDLGSRAVAFHEFGIRLGEELPGDKKFDLIQTFKVAEHQIDVDKELEQYHKQLKDDGYLYISVPTWFGELCNFGMGGFDLEYYYHTDHINVWSKKLFECVLKKTGFQVIKYDGYMYGDTYLCKKTEPQMVRAEDVENPEEVKQWMGKIKQAFQFYKKNQFEEAIASWPNFPHAWNGYYEYNRKEIHKKHDGNGKAIVDDLVKRAAEALGDHAEVDRMKSDIYMRYGHWDLAVETIEQCLAKKPNQAGPLIQMSHCFRRMAEQVNDPDRRIEYLMTARNICRQVTHLDKSAQVEAMNWALVDSTNLPIDDTIDFLKKKQADQQNKGVQNVKEVQTNN